MHDCCFFFVFTFNSVCIKERKPLRLVQLNLMIKLSMHILANNLCWIKNFWIDLNLVIHFIFNPFFSLNVFFTWTGKGFFFCDVTKIRLKHTSCTVLVITSLISQNSPLGFYFPTRQILPQKTIFFYFCKPTLDWTKWETVEVKIYHLWLPKKRKKHVKLTIKLRKKKRT